MASEVPLLNSYKTGFVRRRLLHTLSGVRLFPGKPPAYVWLLRLGLWLAPTSVSIAASLLPLKPLWPALVVSSSLVAILVLSIQILAAHRHEAERNTGSGNVVMDEDVDLEWDGVLGPLTWTLLAPARSYKVTFVITSVLAGIVTFLASITLRYPVIRNFFDSEALTVTLFILGWLTATISLQSLVTHPPHEVGSWRHSVNTDLQSLSRPLILLVCQLSICVGIYFWNVFSIANIFYILQSVLPLLWILGLQPPPETFLLWLGEQLLVFGLGGSPTASSVTFLIQITAALIQLITLLISGLSYDKVLILCSIFGYILSTNWTSIIDVVKTLKKAKVEHGKAKSGRVTTIVKKKSGLSPRISRCALFTEEVITHVILVTLTVALSITMSGSGFEDTDALGWIILAWTAGLCVLREVSKVYTIMGLVRSPFYVTWNMDSGSLKVILVKFLLRFLHPISSSLILLVYILQAANASLSKMEEGVFFLFVNVVSTQRSLRWIWQNPDSALTEAAIYHIVKHVSTLPDSLRGTIFERSEIFQLVLIGFVWSRIVQFVEKIYLCPILLFSSIEDRASRRNYAFLMFQVTCIMAPVIVIVTAVASIISAPLLPVFTLPVFFLTFPRPSRFWPGPIGDNATASSDSIYYEQAASNVLGKFNEAARMMRLGVLQPESMFLLRFEDKIFWIQVMEKGNGFFSYGLKGMELQETSCHSLEAARIDDNFDSAFEKKSLVNSFPLDTLTPLTTIQVKMYSDTKNNLAGVITDKETLKLMAETFVEVLLWLMVKCAKDFETARGESSVDIDEVVQFTPIQDDSKDPQQPDSWPASNSSSSYLPTEAPWAAKSQQNPFKTPELKPKIASVQLNNDGDSVSLSDIADIEDDLFFEKLIQPITKKDKLTEKYPSDNFNQLQPSVDALLPGGLNKTPKMERKTLPALPSRSILLTPSKQVHPLKGNQDNNSIEIELYKIPDEWMLICERENFNFESDIEWFPIAFYESLFKDENTSRNSRLKISYKKFTAFIFESIYGRGSSPRSASNFGPNIIMKGFTNIAKNTNWPQELKDCVQKAFRYAVKIGIDKAVLGTFDDNAELLEAIENVHQNWFVGLETDSEWASSVRCEVPQLFCLCCTNSSESGQVVYRARILTLRDCQVRVGRLNKEVVKSLWANLSLGMNLNLESS